MTKSGKYFDLLDGYQLSIEKKADISMAPINQWQIISPETVLDIITRAVIITRLPWQKNNFLSTALK